MKIGEGNGRKKVFKGLSYPTWVISTTDLCWIESSRLSHHDNGNATFGEKCVRREQPK